MIELRDVDIEPTDITIHFKNKHCDGVMHYDYCGVWVQIYIQGERHVHKLIHFGDNEIDEETALKYKEMIDQDKKHIVLGMLDEYIQKREGLIQVAYPCGCDAGNVDEHLLCRSCGDYVDGDCYVYKNYKWD
jgi:hypothetical protein